MTIENARRKLYDTTFLLGRFRRRAAIRVLAELPEPVAAVLQTPIGGTPEDYARHSSLLDKARGAAAARTCAAAVRTCALLEILCAFQGAFVASGISIDETSEATEQIAVEVEDAGEWRD